MALARPLYGHSSPLQPKGFPLLRDGQHWRVDRNPARQEGGILLDVIMAADLLRGLVIRRGRWWRGEEKVFKNVQRQHQE
jgi:hypothetical protein